LIYKVQDIKFCIALLKECHPDIYVRNNCEEKIENLSKEANHEFLEKTSMAVSLISERDENEILRLWPVLDDFIMDTRAFERAMSTVIDSWHHQMELEIKSCAMPDVICTV
jgi:hypothetical protein